MSLFNNLIKTNKKVIEISANQPFQPVRLHLKVKKEQIYKILKGMDFAVYETQNKCFLLKHQEELTIEGPTDRRFSDLWMPNSVARLSFEGPHKMYVIAPSYDRATDAATFFTQPMVKKYARITAADVCVKLYEDTNENVEMLRKLNYFEDKTAEKSAMEQASLIAQQRYQGDAEDVEEFTKELKKAFQEHVEKGLPEVEHWDLTLTNQPVLETLDDRLSTSRYIAEKVFEGKTSEIF
jgi:hypothetical protein